LNQLQRARWQLDAAGLPTARDCCSSQSEAAMRSREVTDAFTRGYYRAKQPAGVARVEQAVADQYEQPFKNLSLI
jgi:hypothetical protein